jgi:hypothetical protein
LSPLSTVPFEEAILTYLKEKSPNADIYQILDEKFSDDFVVLEQKHGQV